MSHFYYLANVKNKTLFGLGRDWGQWYKFSNEILENPDCLSSLEYLDLFLQEEVYEYSNEQSCKDIAKDIIDFCKDTPSNKIFMFSDSTDDLTICKSLQYKFVKSFFDQEINNEHLLPNSRYNTIWNNNFNDLINNEYYKKYV